MNNENPINFINGEAHHYDEKKKKKTWPEASLFFGQQEFP